MSITEKIRLYAKSIPFILTLIPAAIVQRIYAVVHRYTYHSSPTAKNIVVLGGSFAGFPLVDRLANTLPTGYKIVWIEKNSHLNYVFNFPRFTVLTGQEHKAFIPYDGVAKHAPTGILTRIQDTAINILENRVQLASGKEIEYAYLVIATGSSQPLPVQLSATERDDACRELQGVQELVKQSHKIAIVGGGAVGVELASDIKDFHPDKEVTLIHSRDGLLSGFGRRLGEYALKALRDELKVRVLLGERPRMPPGGSMAKSACLTFSDSREEQFDLIIGCTGQRPNSSILAHLLPDAISEKTARILVRPTLQVCLPDKPNDFDLPIFAFGDVAEHGGPRMARAAWLQAGVVSDNILEMIKGKKPQRIYRPATYIEGFIKLTLGKTHTVMYSMDENGSDVLVASRNGSLDLDIDHAWKMFGSDIRAEEGLSMGKQGKAGGSV